MAPGEFVICDCGAAVILNMCLECYRKTPNPSKETCNDGSEREDSNDNAPLPLVGSLGSSWTFLDLVPYGRQELWEDTPDGRPQSEPYSWWRRHGEY